MHGGNLDKDQNIDFIDFALMSGFWGKMDVFSQIIAAAQIQTVIA
jgi:hypothetical protein